MFYITCMIWITDPKVVEISPGKSRFKEAIYLQMVYERRFARLPNLLFSNADLLKDGAT